MLHCWLSDMDESAPGGGVRGRFRAWLRVQNRPAAAFTAPLYRGAPPTLSATTNPAAAAAARPPVLTSAAAKVKVAPGKRHREQPSVARVFESYEEEKLKKKLVNRW
jgi:hypothetical protein